MASQHWAIQCHGTNLLLFAHVKAGTAVAWFALDRRRTLQSSGVERWTAICLQHRTPGDDSMPDCSC